MSSLDALNSCLQIEFFPPVQWDQVAQTYFLQTPFSPEFKEDVETHIEPGGHMLQHYAHLYIGVQYCPNI